MHQDKESAATRDGWFEYRSESRYDKKADAYVVKVTQTPLFKTTLHYDPATGRITMRQYRAVPYTPSGEAG